MSSSPRQQTSTRDRELTLLQLFCEYYTESPKLTDCSNQLSVSENSLQRAPLPPQCTPSESLGQSSPRSLPEQDRQAESGAGKPNSKLESNLAQHCGQTPDIVRALSLLPARQPEAVQPAAVAQDATGRL
uniref:(northern house mosquito) hypothetical protein n=1 Tax=Culex pipiens TaxID=7175 RepID=A0A8D8CYB4_CULPI